MRLLKTKIKVLFFTLAGLSILAGGFWLHPAQNSQPAEPTAPQISLPGDRFLLKANNYPRLDQVVNESVVRFGSDEIKQAFLATNNLSPDDLKPVPQLSGTYTVAMAPDKLKATGALVAEQKQYVALITPNDPIYPQWYTDKIAAPAAWDIATGSSSTVVAVIDTGFALNHEDLASRWASGGKDFVNNDNDPSAGITNLAGSGVSHGTATAGLIGAASNNARGVAAINWGAKILPLQALDDNGEGTTTNVASAVRYATDQGAKVINMSLGTTWQDPILKAELDYALSHDVVVVAAAGNCGSPSTYFLNGCVTPGQMLYPANYPQVLAVGATDSNDSRASFSSYGSNLDVVAPGSGSISTTAWTASNQTSLYTSVINGTSFSSPIVAGLAALYRGYRPAASANETVNAITGSADKLSSMGGQNFANEYGFGRVNAAHTLSGTPPAPASAAPAPTSPETSATPLPGPLRDIAHPDGTLVRPAAGPNSHQVYLLKNGGASFASSLSVFLSWGFDFSRVKIATQADLNLMAASDADTSHASNPAPLQFREGTLVKGSEATVYVIQNVSGVNRKRSLDSLENFVRLGYSFSEVFNILDSELDPIPTDSPHTTSDPAHPNGTLIRAASSPTVYYVLNGERHSMTSANIFTSHGYKWPAVKIATEGDNQLPITWPVNWFGEGTLVKGSGATVYAIDLDSGGTNMSKRSLASYANFVQLDYYFSEVIQVNDSELPTQSGTDIGY